MLTSKHLNQMIMRNTIKRFSVLIGAIAILFGCSKDDLTELNINKNAVTEMDMSYLFTRGTLRLGGEYENTRAVSIYAAPMIQHTASIASYFSGDKYYYSNQYSGAFMNVQYENSIKLFSQVIVNTEDRPNLNAMATILRAFDLHRMTDLYGDIPYTQAGYGIQDAENWFPKYDNQKDVYTAIVADVKAARDRLSAGGENVGVQDIIFGGDVSKWKKFANALLMRVAMRMSNVDEATASSVFAEAYASGAFSGNDDNASIKYLNGPNGVNRNGLNDGLWGTYKYSRDCKISATFIDWMRANNDPRLMIISGGVGDPDNPATWNTDPAAQIGMPNGFTGATMVGPDSPLTEAQKAEFNTNSVRMFSMLNLKTLDWEDPYMLITYAETELLAAEAMVKGWIGGDANAKFESGVKGAIDSWTLFDGSFARSEAEVGDYISGRGFAAASNSDKLRLIAEEYWAATYLNDIESWSNWRRTGFPELTPTQDANRYLGINIIPRRLKYYDAEVSRNPANYAAAVSRMGPDEFDTRVWWDGGN